VIAPTQLRARRPAGLKNALMKNCIHTPAFMTGLVRVMGNLGVLLF